MTRADPRPLARVRVTTYARRPRKSREGFTGRDSDAFGVTVDCWYLPGDSEALAALPGALERVLAAAAADWIEWRQSTTFVAEVKVDQVVVEELAS